MKHVKTPEQYTETIKSIKIACINVWNNKDQITYCTAYIINDAGETVKNILTY